ncbi:hybrid sensor histidine kinase/response regulator [Echinicola strongylocentroti]|uniref:histidine kinase n=1 Tax=Echinicola strongylocentroti TaxID=1795355 RepID=A0A2Z4IED3_9BACT|nr:two-component regulator propeller domain-containing protein [Echinicola strongylocentroti]AWW29027.1 hybrid sensor histidine kinase/response regulator [Echinicola strongylocentroti]
MAIPNDPNSQMNRFFVSLLYVYLLLTGLSSVYAQEGNYLFGAITVEDGLSNNSVTDIHQDELGYIWMATNSGLNRYDGEEFSVFRNRPNDTTSLSENSVRKIMPGPEGALWLLNRNNVMEVYDASTETFSTSLSQYAKRYGLLSAVVHLVYEDNSGRYWFGHPNQGISIYDPRSQKTVHLKHQEDNFSSISYNYVSAIAENSHGEYWLVYSNGAVDILGANSLKVRRRIELFGDTNVNYTDDFRIFIDSDDDAWIYLYENGEGLFYFDSYADRLHHLHTNSEKVKLNNNQVRGIVENKKNEIWIGTDHGGINVLSKEDMTVNYLQHDPENPHSLAHNSVYELMKDRSGIIWVGTFKNGINLYNEKLIRFPHVKHMLTAKQSLPYNDINCFVEDEKGNFYIGTNGNGLLYFDRKKQRYTEYKHQEGEGNSLPGDIIVDLMIDQNGELWIATYLKGLSRFDGQLFRNYQPDANDPQSLSGESVWELYEDREGNVWAGTLRSGLDLYDPKTDSFIHFIGPEGRFPMHCDYISSLEEDTAGNLWIGGGNGIDVISLKSGFAAYHSHEIGNSSSLAGNNIMDILKDSNGTMWVATTQGLSYFDQAEGVFHNFNHTDGLPSDHVVKILEDNNHNLWLSTTTGLSHVQVSRAKDKDSLSLAFRNFSVGDGLQGNSFNENSALKTSKGELVFGGPNGYNIFYPNKMRMNEESPKVVLTDFQLFNKSVKIGKKIAGRIVLEQNINQTKKLVLKHNENVFAVEFAALNFIHSDKNQYRYMLEGFDSDWVEVEDGVTKATYTNLDPGNYTFKVRAANNDGVWSEKAQMLDIEVLAPFWKTPLAFLIYFVIVALIVIAIQREIIAREKDRLQIAQDREEAKRMKELDKMKTKFFTNVSHEFRTPLTLILAPVEKLLKTTNEPHTQNHYLTIQRNAKRLMNLINQLLDIRKIESEGIDFSPVEGDVIGFLRETTQSFEDLSEKKNIALDFMSNKQQLFTHFDVDKLEKILFNLLSNAFKFTYRGGAIKVMVNYESPHSAGEKGSLSISVQDTGVGIGEEDQKRIFDRYYVGEENSDSLNQGSGIGLSIVQEFARLHDGDVLLESEVGRGSTFTVTLPVEEIAHTELAYEESDEEEMEGIEQSEKKTILLVEDNEEFVHYLKSCLVEEYKVITALNGEEGSEMAFEHIPDMVISDVMMPKMNGVELCQLLKKDLRTSHIPVILLTAKSSEEKQLEGLDSGANHYITKPFNVELLLLRVRNLLNERSLLQERFKKRIGVITSEVKLESLDDRLIQKAVKVVEDNMDNPELSVEMLSGELAMSRVHLYKKLTSLTGKKPLEFIRMIRLERATQLLGESQLTVAEVAYQVGYNNAKYFTKHFKAEYQVLPSVYAQQKVEAAHRSG